MNLEKYQTFQKTVANTGYTSGGFQSNLQAQGSLARAVTVDSESATEPARCIPSTLALILMICGKLFTIYRQF